MLSDALNYIKTRIKRQIPRKRSLIMTFNFWYIFAAMYRVALGCFIYAKTHIQSFRGQQKCDKW